MEAYYRLKAFYVILLFILYGISVYGQDVKAPAVWPKSDEAVVYRENSFYFDILPYDNSIENKFLLVSFSNREIFTNNRRQFYQNILDRMQSETKDLAALQKDPDYKEAQKWLSDFNDNYPQDFNKPLWIEFYQPTVDRLLVFGTARVGNFDYRTNISVSYLAERNLYVSLLKYAVEINDKAPILMNSNTASVFLSLNAVPDSVKQNIHFVDIETMQIINLLNENLVDLSGLKIKDLNENTDMFSAFSCHVMDDSATGTFGFVAEHIENTPMLPYSSIYYYDTQKINVIKLPTYDVVQELDDYNPTIYDFIYSNDGDTLNYGKPIIYDDDKVLYWYCLSNEKQDSLVYVLVCYDIVTNTVYYLDAVILNSYELSRVYKARSWRDDKWDIKDWSDRWSWIMAKQIQN